MLAKAAPRPTRAELAALAVILIVAAALRFGWPGTAGFAWDEARISLDALRMARNGELVLAGQPSSVEIPFFPLSVWLFALPFAMSPDPLFASLAVSAVSLACVAGVWSLARPMGRAPGLAAAAFMAAAPYAVLYGRSIWQPNLLAPLGLAWMLAFVAAARRSGRGGLIAAFAIGAIGAGAVQVHFAGAPLALATGFALLRLRWRARVALIAGGLFGLLAAVPYFIYITQIDPRVAARFGAALGGETAYDLSGLASLGRLIAQWDWAFLGLGDADPFGRALWPTVGAAALLAAGALAMLRWRGPWRPLAEATGAVMLALPIVFIRHSSPVLIHYALTALPAAAVLAGAAAGLTRSRAWVGATTGAIATLAAIWALQVGLTLDAATRERPPNSALSSILSEPRDAIAAAAPDASVPVLAFTHGHDPVLHGEAAVFKALLWPRPHRIIDGENLLILPNTPAVLLASLAPFQMWEELDASGLALGASAHPRRAGAPPYLSVVYDGTSDPAGFTSVEPTAWADGTAVIGWRARFVGDRLRISTLWRVEVAYSGPPMQGFHHLRPATAPESAPMVSDVALTRASWLPGDRVIVMADFFGLAPGSAWTVDIGRYTLPDIARIPRADGANDGALRLGPTLP